MPASETVEARGHLIDSQLMTRICDKVIEHQGQFEIIEFNVGKTNAEFSTARLRITAPGQGELVALLEELMPLGCYMTAETDAQVKKATVDRCVPDDFYSTTNHRTSVRISGEWRGPRHRAFSRQDVTGRESRDRHRRA